MGRRHLILVTVLAAAALTAASAGAGLKWRELGRGTATGVGPETPIAMIALDRAAATRWSSRLPAAGRSEFAHVDFGRDAVVAVFGSFGCKDHRIAVTNLARQGPELVVSLVERPLAPGTMECLAIYPTYRLLAVPKAALAKPYPTRAEARLG